MGRPTKCTRRRRERICEAIRAGNHLAVAAGYAGVDRGTLQRWMKRGLADGEEARRYRIFRRAILKAVRDSEVALVAMMRRAATSDWRAAAAILERRFPRRWSRRERTRVDATVHAPELAALADAAARVRERIARLRGFEEPST